MKKIYPFLIFILLLVSAKSQNPEWAYFNDGKWITDLVEEGNYLWIGTSCGLVRMEKSTGVTVLYNTDNSQLPNNWIKCIAVDAQGIKWIGTRWGGLSRFDGTSFTNYNPHNSPLPGPTISGITIDQNGNKWMTISNSGLVKFDGTTWTVYNTSNSGIASNGLTCIDSDNGNNLWIGSWDKGLLKFDGTSFTRPGGTDTFITSVLAASGS